MRCMWRSLHLWWGQITFTLWAQVIIRHHKISDLLTQFTRLWWFCYSITSVWITYVIHKNSTNVLHMFHTCNTHVKYFLLCVNQAVIKPGEAGTWQVRATCIIKVLFISNHTNNMGVYSIFIKLFTNTLIYPLSSCLKISLNHNENPIFSTMEKYFIIIIWSYLSCLTFVWQISVNKQGIKKVCNILLDSLFQTKSISHNEEILKLTISQS